MRIPARGNAAKT